MGWTTSRIADLIGADGLFVDGDWVESKDQDPGGDVRLTQLADIGDGIFRDRSNRFLTSSTAATLRCTNLHRGDVLVARMPDPLGRACLFPGSEQTCVTVVDVCIIRPGAESVDSRWLMWWINTPWFRHEILARQAGTTRKRISRRNLASIEFLVPPLREQRRIVEVIEEQFSRLDASEQLLKLAKQRLNRLRQAILTQAVEGDWPVRPLETVLESLRNGVFVSRPARHPPGLPIFRISAVRRLALDINDIRFADIDPQRAGGYFVEEGDLLFTRYSGNPNYVGACAPVPALSRPILHPDKLIRAVVDRSVVDPTFVAIALSVGRGRRAIEERRKTTAGQIGIAGNELKRVPVSLPSLDEQRRIVADLERPLSVIDATAREIDVAVGRSAALRRSVLKQAFIGELVPQDPAAEPASVLLERIAAARASEPKVSRKRRKMSA